MKKSLNWLKEHWGELVLMAGTIAGTVLTIETVSVCSRTAGYYKGTIDDIGYTKDLLVKGDLTSFKLGNDTYNVTCTKAD